MMENDWKKWLKRETKKSYFQKLKEILIIKYQNSVCFPPWDKVFRAFQLTPKEKIKVVILGQDPYPNYHQADGLAFSVAKTQALPGSLKNILLELTNNYPHHQTLSGDLTNWAREGVFLLNSILTVEEKKPLAHQKLGWETFTDNVLKEINLNHQGIIFVFWGKKAQEKVSFITNKSHTILTSAHPSPLSAHQGFLGSKIFWKINFFLKKQGKTPINWIK